MSGNQTLSPFGDDDTADGGKIAGRGLPAGARAADGSGAPAPAEHPGPTALADRQYDPSCEQPARESVAGTRGRAPIELDIVADAPHRALLRDPASGRPDCGQADGRARLLRDPGSPGALTSR